MVRVYCPVLICAICILGPLLGCRPQSLPSSEDVQRAAARRHGTLSQTRAAKLTALRAELDQIEREGGLPTQLTARRTPAADSRPGWVMPDGSRLPDSDNALAVLPRLFAPEEIRLLKKQFSSLYPAGPFNWSEKQLAGARELRRKFDEPLRVFEHALERPRAELCIPYIEGYLADPGVLEPALVANRLLATRIAEQLADRDIQAAIESWPQLLIVPAALTRAGNLTTRAAAAQLRSEALRILEVFVRLEDLAPDQLEQLRLAVEDHHAEWPAEAATWDGERACGLHTYEMIRAGELLSLLDYGRLQQLRRSGALRDFGQRVLDNLDEDQQFYLSAVRRIAEESQQPYRERRATLDELQQQLGELAGSPRYPIIAGDVLWADLEWGVRLQACDRALWGGWRAGLHTATGLPQPSDAINPLTGSAYDVVRRGAFWEIRDVDLLGDQLQLTDEPLLIRAVSSHHDSSSLRQTRQSRQDARRRPLGGIAAERVE